MLLPNNKGVKTLETKRITKIRAEKQTVDEKTLKREKMLIWLLLNNPEETYSAIQNTIHIEDIKDEQNRKIVAKLYEQYESGNSNINSLLDTLEGKDVSYVTGIMADNFEIVDINKGIFDILTAYEREKLILQKEEIISKLEKVDISAEESKELGEQLRNIMAKLAK